MPSQPQPVVFSVAIGGLLSTGIALAAVLWPSRLTPELQASIIAFGNAVILTASIIWASRRVTPVASPILPAGTAVTTPAGESATVTPT